MLKRDFFKIMFFPGEITWLHEYEKYEINIHWKFEKNILGQSIVVTSKKGGGFLLGPWYNNCDHLFNHSIT